MSMSTMMAILGRMVAYTGQSITMDQALNSQQDLTDVARSSRLVTSRRKIEEVVQKIQKSQPDKDTDSKLLNELAHASSHIDQAQKSSGLFNDTLKQLSAPDALKTSITKEMLSELSGSIKEYVDISKSKPVIQDSSDFEWGDLDFPPVAVPGVHQFV